MRLDLSSLRLALGSLESAILRAKSAPGDDIVQSAVIQRFEYTYELCWKMIKRQVESEAATPSLIDHLGFADLMREAAERGLISDVTCWLVYRSQRNLTSHTYDQNKAIQVYETAIEFAEAGKQLLNELERRNPG